MTRIRHSYARTLVPALLAAVLAALATVPWIVWGDGYPVAAAVAAVAVSALVGAILGERERRRTLQRDAAVQKLDALSSLSTEAVVWLGEEGEPLAWNAAAETLFGTEGGDESDAGLVLADVTEIVEDGIAGREVVDRKVTGRAADEAGASLAISARSLPAPAAGAVLIARDVGEAGRLGAEKRGVEARYRALVETVPTVTYVHEPGRRERLLFVSPQVDDLLGYSADELLSDPELSSKLVHPEDRPRVEEHVRVLASAGALSRCRYRVLARDGRTVDVLDAAMTIRDEAGTPLATQGCLLDVTERRRAGEERERLRLAERAAVAEAGGKQRRLDFLSDASEVIVRSAAVEAGLARAAALATKTFGGWCIIDLVQGDGTVIRHHVERDEGSSSRDSEPATEPEAEIRDVARTGQPHIDPTRISVPLTARGRIVGVLTLLRDPAAHAYESHDLLVTETLGRLAALAIDAMRLYEEVEERADAARVLTYVGEGVALVDRSGVIRLWNPAAEAISGLSAESVMGHPAAEVIPNWQRLQERIPVAPSSGPAQAEELPLETPQGERWISISGVEFFGGTVHAFRDVTDEHRLESLKADFVATASHELRTPLAAVYGAAQTLRRHDFALDETGRERFVSMIVDESDRLGRIVNEILLANQLDVGRVAFSREPFDPADLVERAVESARTYAPAEVTLDFSAPVDMPAVAADRERARQVLVNLLDNAIKYSPDGGRVDVGIETELAAVRFYVRDQGLGIPADEQARIFEKFYRADPDMLGGVGGTGLGLYICSELIERMGGRIWVESGDEEGSTFFFTLPRAERAASAATADDAPEQSTNSGRPPAAGDEVPSELSADSRSASVTD